MNLGIDFHDTLSYAPDFFLNLAVLWNKTTNGQIYIVTGTPASKRDIIDTELKRLGFEGLYKDILMGYEYHKEDMTIDHFTRMKMHKLKLLQEHNVNVYFDDNPFYAHWMKEYGIIVFMPCINPTYLKKFAKSDLFFSCHLQEKIFDFLYTLTNKDVQRR